MVNLNLCQRLGQWLQHKDTVGLLNYWSLTSPVKEINDEIIEHNIKQLANRFIPILALGLMATVQTGVGVLLGLPNSDVECLLIISVLMPIAIILGVVPRTRYRKQLTLAGPLAMVFPTIAYCLVASHTILEVDMERLHIIFMLPTWIFIAFEFFFGGDIRRDLIMAVCYVIQEIFKNHFMHMQCRGFECN